MLPRRSARACGAPGSSPVPRHCRPGCCASTGVGRDSEGVQALGREAPAELGGEEQVGQLGGAVAEPGVARGGAGDVAGLDVPNTVHVGRDGDDPRSIGGDDTVQQQARQREVAQVVGGHLQLEPVCCLAVGRAHHARVVDQDVEPGMRGQDPGCTAVHRDQIGQVEVEQLERRAVELALELVAARVAPSPRSGTP